jgi:hypothetical protein
LRRLNEAEVALAVRGDELVGRVRVVSRSAQNMIPITGAITTPIGRHFEIVV